MTNITNKSITSSGNYAIHERMYGFVVRVVKLVNSLPKTESNLVISHQLLRSATSVGANDQEADGCLTRKDFLHCYTIVRKELKETLFWLKLISDTNPKIKNKMELIVKENQELVSIVSAIINKARPKTAVL